MKKRKNTVIMLVSSVSSNREHVQIYESRDRSHYLLSQSFFTKPSASSCLR
jgi:hypothetical protein